MIRTFASKDAEALFQGKRVRRWVRIETVAMRKLAMLNRAARLDDLRIPPANRREALRGDRTGQYSIRVNDQYRICFVWKNGAAWDVEIVAPLRTSSCALSPTPRPAKSCWKNS